LINKTNIFAFLASFIMAFSLHGCKYFELDKKEKAVARVFDNYLFINELQEAISDQASEDDSIEIARTYIDTWVRKQLMLHQAENALSSEQKDFEKKLEEYRSSLIIYSYRQKLIQQKLDTSVSNQDIIDYYEDNIDNFMLNDEIVKAIFVKIPLDAPKISNVRTWTKSGNIESIDKLEKYCVNYAEKFDMFNNSWIYFSSLMNQVPLTIDQPQRFLRYNKNIETTDSAFHYFIKILDHKTEGDITPMSLMRNDIKSILLNKRKIEFYKELDNQIYNNGVNRNSFEIY